MALYPCPACGAERSSKESDCTSCSWMKRKPMEGGGPDPLEEPMSYELVDIARAQKMMIYAVIASIVSWPLTPLLLVAIPLQIYAIYRISRALGYSGLVTCLCIVAMFIPFISLICLASLNSKATSRLTSSGIRVGLLGAKMSDFG
jgi:hypothetical protein